MTTQTIVSQPPFGRQSSSEEAIHTTCHKSYDQKMHRMQYVWQTDTRPSEAVRVAKLLQLLHLVAGGIFRGSDELTPSLLVLRGRLRERLDLLNQLRLLRCHACGASEHPPANRCRGWCCRNTMVVAELLKY